ncbi:MAG TPA: bifunctional DNA-formamidopyrimidine glycosylase/DNA-(apurinic or apyrimidinic site) lyase [Candidatus Sulfotelmatobacter sp.]|nr:bifunctional DNA-formamidopyrimidine glycosylase/DNA-(apurinic or apyrimidinic site) lyase [Candidatus Sulfotelmatobacter sp.]
MPELPEVETVKLGLQKYLVGHVIENVDIKVPKLFQGDQKNIIGAKVKDVRRKGKGLIIDLSNNYSLAIHIKLTGQLIYRDKGTENVQVSKEKVGTLPSSATHVIFKLDKGAILYYNDRRRFGWIKVVKTDQVDELPFFKTLGPEPFKDLTESMFKTILSKSGVAVKPLIMDQKRIGGIGNIYANDALFMAGINPKRPAKSLSSKEVKDLYEAVLSVMEKSFKYGGASELNFVNVLGQEGEYQNHSLVYGKQGQKCPRDGTIIKKYFLGGRGTYVCEKHQK